MHRNDDIQHWSPSDLEFPEADHGYSSNPPTVIGKPVPPSSVSEIIQWHKNNGSLTKDVLEHCGIFQDGDRER